MSNTPNIYEQLHAHEQDMLRAARHTKKATVRLSAWDLAALEVLVEAGLADRRLDAVSGKALLARLRAATVR